MYESTMQSMTSEPKNNFNQLARFDTQIQYYINDWIKVIAQTLTSISMVPAHLKLRMYRLAAGSDAGTRTV